MGFANVDSAIWGLEISEENCICTEHAQIFVVVVIPQRVYHNNYVHSVYTALGIVGNLERTFVQLMCKNCLILKT